MRQPASLAERGVQQKQLSLTTAVTSVMVGGSQEPTLRSMLMLWRLVMAL